MFSSREVAQYPNNPYQVLVADDSDDDRFMLRRGLRVNPTFKIVAEACNGEEAIKYLNGRGIFSDREKYPFPDLLLLDLKMPRVNGYEVLGWLRNQSFENLMVVVVSDFPSCLELGADGYYVKSASPGDQATMFQELEPLLNRQKGSAQSRTEMAQKPNKPYHVLVVDDSDDDRFMLRRGLRVNSTFKIVAEACNGEEAIKYLNGTGIFSDREKYPLPDLLLLDLKMPRLNGYEVLGWLGNQSFENLKVVVLSGSIMEKDIHHCLELGANAYYPKTASLARHETMFQEIEALLNPNKASAQSRPEV